jgi:hypothetical protein
MDEMGGLAIDYFTMLVRRELALDGYGMLVLDANIHCRCILAWRGDMSVWRGSGCSSN